MTPTGALHKVLLCPMGPPLLPPTPQASEAATARHPGHAAIPPAVSTFRREGLQLPVLEAHSHGSRTRSLPPPLAALGGRHGRRGGPACPTEVGHEWAGAMSSKCTRAALSAAAYTAQGMGGQQAESPPWHKGATLFQGLPSSSRFPPASQRCAFLHKSWGSLHVK